MRTLLLTQVLQAWNSRSKSFPHPSSMYPSHVLRVVVWTTCILETETSSPILLHIRECSTSSSRIRLRQYYVIWVSASIRRIDLKSRLLVLDCCSLTVCDHRNAVYYRTSLLKPPPDINLPPKSPQTRSRQPPKLSQTCF